MSGSAQTEVGVLGKLASDGFPANNAGFSDAGDCGLRHAGRGRVHVTGRHNWAAPMLGANTPFVSKVCTVSRLALLPNLGGCSTLATPIRLAMELECGQGHGRGQASPCGHHVPIREGS